jgi:hypothetical protein
MRTLFASGALGGGLYWIATHDRLSDMWVAAVMIAVALFVEFTRE